MTIATLAGIALDASGGDLSWSQQLGMDPGVTTFTLERKRAEAIFAKAAGEPVTLQLGERTIDRLWVTSIGAGGSPHARTLVVKDERWLWQRYLTHRTFNKRSRTPIRKLRGEGDPVNRPVTPTFAYKEYSLNGGEPWTLKQAIISVLDELQAEFGTPYSIDDIDRQIEFEDFSETTDASSLLGRLVGFAAGYEIALKDDGTVILVDTHDGTGQAELGKAGPVIVGSGWVETSDRRYERPAWVDVYYLPENELRFDFLEGNTTTDSTRLLTNVVQVQEREVKINGEDVAEGSYVNLTDYFTWLDGKEVGIYKMNLPFLLNNYLKQQIIDNNMIIDRASGQPNLLWATRVKSIMTHFRQTFAIAKEWMDRLQSVKAERLAIVDTATKTRAQAQAFTQWSAWPNRRMIYQNSRSKSFKSGWYRDDYATLLKDARPVRADISVRDSQAGIVRVYLLKDALSEAFRIIPGLPRDNNLSSLAEVSMRSPGGAAAVAEAILRSQVPLQQNHRLALVLTGVRAAADRKGLVALRVPYDLAARAGKLPASTQPALGPPVSVFITPGATTTFRMAWDDEKSAIIDKFFEDGLDAPIELTSTNIDTPIQGLLGSLCVNSDAVSALAIGTALSVYSRFLDRGEGGYRAVQRRDGPGGPQVSGELQRVTTTVTGGGEIFEQYDLPRILQAIDPLSGVSAPIRQRLLGLLEAP